MSESTIPPPSAEDMRHSLLQLHEMPVGDDGLKAVTDRAVYFWALIRRCHAAETELASIRDIVRERLGKVPCDVCNKGDAGEAYYNTPGHERDAPCPKCGGHLFVYLADTMPLVDVVQMLLRQRDELERRLKILFDWYHHDGSEGGLDRAFEEASSK